MTSQAAHAWIAGLRVKLSDGRADRFDRELPFARQHLPGLLHGLRQTAQEPTGSSRATPEDEPASRGFMVGRRCSCRSRCRDVPSRSGATIRVYLERYEGDAARLDLPIGEVLAEVVEAARSVSDIAALTGRTEPSVVT